MVPDGSQSSTKNASTCSQHPEGVSQVREHSVTSALKPSCRIDDQTCGTAFTRYHSRSLSKTHAKQVNSHSTVSRPVSARAVASVLHLSSNMISEGKLLRHDRARRRSARYRLRSRSRFGCRERGAPNHVMQNPN